MADLAFVNQHNMVAYLEKSDENAEFHQIVDFLSTCSINYALTVSPTIYASYIEQFWNTATSKTVNSVKQIHAIVDGKAVVISESSVRNDLLFDDEDGITCLTNDDIFENLALMGQSKGFSEKVTPLLDSMLVQNHAPEGEGNGYRWQSQAPRNHRGALAQTRSEKVLEKPNEPPLPEGYTSESGEGSMEHTFELMDIVPPTPYDSPLTGGYTPGSDEGRLKLKELMAMYTKLSKQVLDLEKEKDAQAVDRDGNRQVESSNDDLDEEDASDQGRKSDKTKSMFKDSDFDVLNDDMETVDGETVNTATTGVSVVSAPVTTAGVAISTAEPRTPPTTAVTAFIDEDLTIARTLVKMRSEKAKEKGVAFKDLAELDRAQKEKEKQEDATNAALAKEFDEIQARMDADHELVVRLIHEEQEKYTIEERATLLAEYFERRKKQLAAERVEAIRNKPPTRAQVRNMMITYLKHMDSEEDGSNTKKARKRIKRIADSTSKKKSLKKYKYPIVDWESQNLRSVDMEDIHVYKIIRADGNTSYHKTFSSMLRKFDRQYLMDLHRLVMKRFEDNTPEGYNLLLWGDLKVMFEPNAEDEIWSNQQD
ncbi:hypothetical protein Tco_1018623 [Tanacetum coccineum]|uniref:Xylulose kinase-1 n=1 Tax=Tanacetum coccineum TaxID=301880 RepID=A0ABQ5FW75_9ASTR